MEENKKNYKKNNIKKSFQKRGNRIENKDDFKDKKNNETINNLEEKEYEDIIEGRNSVIELLSANKDVNKIYIQKGEKHGSINKIIAMAKEKKVVTVEVEKNKLDFMSKTKNHQGVIATIPPFNYCEVEDILEYDPLKPLCMSN